MTNENITNEARDIRTIKVIVKHCQTKDGKKKFDAYRAVQTDGRLIDCRFNMTVPQSSIPTERFLMRVDATQMNVSRAYEYPRLYVKNVVEFLPIVGNSPAASDEDLPF